MKTLKTLKNLKDKISGKMMMLYATLLSAIPFNVFAEDRKVNTKYFGNNQEFWGDLKTWYLWFMGFLWSITIILTIIAATVASGKLSVAKMSGNSSKFNREMKNYSQLIINITAGIAFISLLATLLGAYIFFK